MKAQLATSLMSDLISTLWTPAFVALFVAVLVYALWPRNRADFDKAAKIPLED
jgi:cytochrome c oxidase cbb3-type subunit IV